MKIQATLPICIFSAGELFKKRNTQKYLSNLSTTKDINQRRLRQFANRKKLVGLHYVLDLQLH